MANSKSDKAPKVMDVTQPGKSAPSASSRPIIVSNRPMLRQDPMMSSVSHDQSEELTAFPVSRVARTISVLPAQPAKEASVAPAPVKVPEVAHRPAPRSVA